MRTMIMEEMGVYCNRYGFIFQGSEIYGGLANTWDYGPLGTRLSEINAVRVISLPQTFL